MESAILREKQLKKWSRVAKKRLIELRNPLWQDLWPDLALPSMTFESLHSMPDDKLCKCLCIERANK